MKIVGIDCHVLLVPDYDAAACSSAQDNLVVEVHTDAGLVGVGETDTNPWVARECIRARPVATLPQKAAAPLRPAPPRLGPFRVSLPALDRFPLTNADEPGPIFTPFRAD